MKIVNVHQAKTHLSRLLEQAHAGEEIIIAKSGEPYARLAPLPDRAPKRQPGTHLAAPPRHPHTPLVVTNAKGLSRKVRRLIQEDDTKVYVSAVSVWEIATKVRLGKLKWTNAVSIESYCISQRFECLPVLFASV